MMEHRFRLSSSWQASCREARHSVSGAVGITGRMWDACGMPWLPELFSAPALQRVLDARRREQLVAVPYFDGLLSGEPDALVE
jgi:hypothetical protein